MSQKVPMKDFKWVDQGIVDSLTATDIMKLDPNGDTGYVLEVDVEIPTEIHDRYDFIVFLEKI